MQRVKRAYGSALVGVVLVAALALLAAFTVASASTWNLHVAYRVENQQMALDLADSALQQAVAELQHDPEYGLTPKEVLVESASLPTGASGRVFFDATGQAYSTNNLKGDRPTGWGQRPVPTGRVHLLAVGRCRGVERTVEAMVYAPRFPRAVASDGPVELKGSLVASVNRLSDAVDGSGNLILDPTKLRRGDVVSNDNATLSEASVVKGSAQARLQVVSLDTSRVEGEVLAPYERAAFPDISVTSYDPKTDPDTLYQPHSAGDSGSLNLSGITRFDDGAVRINGDLKLDNAMVYIAGDLVVTGHIEGVGALFVKGKTEVGGGIKLSASDNVALLSDGDLRLRGDGKASSFFVGLVYSRGVVSANNLTIVGSLLARQKAFVSRCNVVGLRQPDISLMFRKTNVTFANTQHRDVFPGQIGAPSPDKTFLATRVNDGSVRAVMEAGGYQPGLPAVLEVDKRDGRFFYTLRYWHIDGSRNVNGPSFLGPTDNRPEFAKQVAKLMANEERKRNLRLLDGGVYTTWRGKFLLEFNRSLDLCEKYEASKPGQESVGNFDLSLNRFLSEGESLRVVYRREL